MPFDIKKIAEEIAQSAVRGKKSNLVVMAEGAGRMEDVCSEFEKYSGIKPRQTRLGFIQRGGSPTYRDRLLACLFGIEAVKLLIAGKTDRVVGIRGEKIIDEDIYEALAKKKKFNTDLHLDAGVLT